MTQWRVVANIEAASSEQAFERAGSLPINFRPGSIASRPWLIDFQLTDGTQTFETGAVTE